MTQQPEGGRDDGGAEPGSAAPATILERMTAAGIDPERAHAHLDAEAVVVDGEHVSDPATPAPWGTSRWAVFPK